MSQKFSATHFASLDPWALTPNIDAAAAMRGNQSEWAAPWIA
jgi:hypothetical protein